MQRQIVWALVLNATRARIVRDLDPDPERKAGELVLRAEARKLRDIMTDKPGRSFASAGGGRRSGMDYASDPVEEDAIAFVREVISLLESHRRAEDFHRLAVFAAPAMLGHLRKEMPRALAATVILEETKNLMQEPEQPLRELIRAEVQAAR